MRPVRPSPEDLRLAAEWCRNYETEPEAGRLAEVAEWLDGQAVEATLEAFVAAAVLETGRSAAEVRRSETFRAFARRVREEA